MLPKLRSLAALVCLASLAACGGSGSSAGTAAPTLPLQPSATTIAFSTTQAVGTASAFQTITLTNNSTSDVTLSSITLGGTNPAAFSWSSNCTSDLPTTASCTIWVTFGPVAATAYSASLSIASNAPSSPTVVTLTGTGVASATASNVAPLVVDVGPIGYLATGYYQVNQIFTTVTVCTPGSTTNCQVIDHVLVDTSSTGLRLVGQALTPGGTTPAGGATPTQLTVGGNALRECVNFGNADYTWGSIVALDVYLGGGATPAMVPSMPVALIGDATAGSAPTDCAALGTNVSSVSDLGVNGYLGINSLTSNYDCPSCVAAAQPTTYYSCPANGSCTATAVPLASQAVNPVAALPGDNNGVVVALNAPALATGGQSVTGYLFFGVNTEANNNLTSSPNPAAQLLTVSSSGAFTTTFGASVLTSYLSSTSYANYFYSSTLTACTDYTNYYCPPASTPESATLTGQNGLFAGVNFNVDNADVDFANFEYSALPGLSGPAASGSPFFWGVPFFYGRYVYVLFGGQAAPGTNPLVTGPAIGF